ncbi:DNA repair protein RecN [Glaciecola petra]|uniref:DNA repair protein RecN n=1 Tax=Glaciecola petra TaxID=3075602 RepID=A0ABU2ZMW4_9ALTE|nr:DNA repair protein RecN [Aestuariibacter sp. P117]MDT0593967.1 DNA repair protein RecN [Aestuariibacter sp. P117]
MLVHIAIKNLAIVKKVELTLGSGLTAITGETGAGKSIALDALGLCLGNRAESNTVRTGADKAEVVAHFDLGKLKRARKYLNEHELAQDDNPDECFVRRVISAEGRSKAFVNGIPVNLTQLKTLGTFLGAIYSQHAHHEFLKTDNQRSVLDAYGKHAPLTEQLALAFSAYTNTKKQLDIMSQQSQQRAERMQLLAYQVEELDEFSLTENEFEELENQVKKLHHTQDILLNSERALECLESADNSDALSLINQSIKAVSDIIQHDDSVQNVSESLYGALAQLEEACNDLKHYQNTIEADPEQLILLENRYSECLDIARKHKVSPENLFQMHMELVNELSLIKGEENNLITLQDELLSHEANYKQAADALFQARKLSAAALANEIQTSIREMNLPHALVQVSVNEIDNKAPAKNGNHLVEILLSVNPGQVLEPIEKVVSGGELSRIGLAIQVICSKENHIPTMVFDEVDTGISGPTAALVGRLLRKLGKEAQVMCVTHLPQVAAQAHHQLFVSKSTDGKTTETNLLKLTKDERVNEIARLLAGDELTDTAIANAKDLLSL